MISKWRNFWSLHWQGQLVLLQAILCLPLVRFSLSWLGLKRVQPSLKYLPLFTFNLDIVTIADLVNMAARSGIWWATCLERSLLLQAFLRHRLIDSDLRIGVNLMEGRFEAHAWVEYDGIVLNDRQDIADSFAVFEGNFSDLRFEVKT